MSWQLEILHYVTILLLLFQYHVKNVHYKRIDKCYELNLLLLFLYYIKNVFTSLEVKNYKNIDLIKKNILVNTIKILILNNKIYIFIRYIY